MFLSFRLLTLSLQRTIFIYSLHVVSLFDIFDRVESTELLLYNLVGVNVSIDRDTDDVCSVSHI